MIENNITGDEGLNQLQLMLSTILKKDLIPKPSVFIKGMDMVSHLNRVNQFIKAIGIDDDAGKIAILITTLDDDIYSELGC